MFSKLFKKKEIAVDDRPTAYPVNYSGKGVFMQTFKTYDYAVIFEDDGKTGYFYATDKANSKIFDALLLFNYDDKSRNFPEGQIFIVINESLEKAGIFYNNKFQAVFDFKKEKGSNRLESTTLKSSIWKVSHTWNEEIIIGLEP